MKKNVLRGLSCVFALLLTVSVCATLLAEKYAGNVNAFLGIQSGSVSNSNGEYAYKTAYTEDGVPSDEGMKKLIAAEDAFNKEAMEESAVLLYNDGALPFGSDIKKVTLLGKSTVDPIYRGGGAGPTIDTNRVVDLPAAMTAAGFELNTTVLDAYRASSTKRNAASHSIGEETSTFYTDSIKSSFARYGDAAIIMFTRAGGEGNDLAVTDADGVRELSLHPAESDLLKLAKQYKDNGTFKNIVVLINSAYAMELDWVYDEQYGVDAMLWIGNPGLTGFSGVPSVLKGEANPSGHLVDSYAVNSLSSAAAQNLGDAHFKDTKQSFNVYAENIYVGYKYYEARYEDLILGRHNASSTAGTFASADGWDYAEEMTFPFGYGLSYTAFSQTLDSVEWKDDGSIVISVTVENTGSVAGKSVVQVYAQVPYTQYDIDRKVEKSAIQLLDFGKTGLLKAGDSETVEIVADQYLLASWDSTAHEGEGGYILDDGDYYIAIGDDVHDALNNILAAKEATGMYDARGNDVAGTAEKTALHKIETFDDETYSRGVGNVFEGIFATDYNAFDTGDSVTYLTRNDWETFPVKYDALTYTEQMEKLHNGDFYDDLKEIVGAPEQHTPEQDAGILFIDMKDVGWDDDAQWEKFLSQLSVGELASIVADSWGQRPIESISKPQNYQCDGPDGGSIKYKYGDKGNNTAYVNEGTMACSWNKNIFRRRGEFLAEDAFYNNTNLTMAPGVDIHRTPYSGRNHEYYSECGVMAYLLGSVQCKAMQDKGTVAQLKHLAANDSETNRSGICEFMREQSFREIALKGFEGCMRSGGAMSAMTGVNCLGVINCARNYALCTRILRDEWDWKGFLNTDANACSDTPALDMLSGIDEFCLNATMNREVTSLVNGGDRYLLDALMRSNKRFYYTYLRSNLINGITRDTKVTDSAPWWESSLIALDVVVGVFALATLAGAAVLTVTGKEKLFGRKGGKHE